MSNDKEIAFKPETIKHILKKTFTEPKTKISDDAVRVLAEVLRLYTIEAALRSGVQASREASSTVSINHIEKILPQLILDL
ncbi:centromere protein X [Nilaparvata lugens]|uniref:centromere protein X n=1 Tax=Nilaparvata lugens TaxID=108931 RepID=UPI000B9850FE|nr:centromere protein X [Nilaparvata lugens]